MSGPRGYLAHNIGEYFFRTGKYLAAEKMYQQALELTKAAFGNAHPSTLNSMNSLASVYEQKGKYAEAEALQQQMLELIKTALGDAHPSKLNSMNNLRRRVLTAGQIRRGRGPVVAR
jgi:tetratricopeptide (TPR) repeat protein